MVSMLDSRLKGLGWSPGRVISDVFLGKTLNSHSASLPPRGVLKVYMTGGVRRSFILQILDSKKYLASKFPTQKNTRLKYLNTDLFNKQNFLMHDFASISL